MNIEFFTNDRYVVLKIMSEREVLLKNKKTVCLNQQEIANEAHFTKQKVNQIIKELTLEGFIEKRTNNRERYVLSSKANQVIELLQNKAVEGNG